MDSWRGNIGMTRGDIEKSRLAFRVFLEILSLSLEQPSPLLRQYWEGEYRIDNVTVYLALDSLERFLKYDTPLSKVWIFNDQQDTRGGNKYDAVYAFFTKTEETREGTYRWKIDKKHEGRKCLAIWEWAVKYQKVEAPASESEEETIGKHVSRKRTESSRKHGRSALNTQWEPWIERRLPEPRTDFERGETFLLPSSTRLSGPSTGYGSRRITYEETADVRKHTFCKRNPFPIRLWLIDITEI
jgi:hypothetical protein